MRSTSERRIRFGSALILALALAGCGGSGGGGSNDSDGGTGTNGSPTITSQPRSVAALAGSRVTLTVAATGTGTVAYQWKRDGTAIPGATSATYTIPALSAATAGFYAVDVTNASGTTTSRAASVSIAAQTAPRITTQPASRGATLGGSVSFNVTVSGTGTIAYQWKKDGAALEGETGPTLRINPVTAESAGTYTVTATNALGSVTSDPATLTITVAPIITTGPDSITVNAGQTVALTVVATGTAPLTYRWTKITGANPGVVAGATGPTLTIANATTAASGTYRVTVSNAYGSATSDTVTVTVVGPPSITTQPTSLTVGEGDSVTFTVVATGTGSLRYQWTKDGGNIAGATSSTYTIANAASTDAAKYAVIVTNDAGSTGSGEATLTVLKAPTITAQPTSLTVTAGQSATFSVTATASGALTYQWYRNGALITGATSASYTLATTTTADSGATFKVEVRNSGLAPRTSNSATLTVNP